MQPIKIDNQGDGISREAPNDRVALYDLGSGDERVYTYGDIRRLSAAVARGFLKRGFQRGDHIAILSANRAEVLLTFLGAMQAGLVAVMVNYKLPAEGIHFIIADSQSKFVLGDDARLRLAPDGVPK